jgi:predicted DNA-binding protein
MKKLFRLCIRINPSLLSIFTKLAQKKGIPKSTILKKQLNIVNPSSIVQITYTRTEKRNQCFIFNISEIQYERIKEMSNRTSLTISEIIYRIIINSIRSDQNYLFLS